MKYIKIENCSQCPHKDHSGKFTPGGAYPICNHDKVCYEIKELSWKTRILPNNNRIYTNIIPNWCPLEDIK